MGVTNYLTMDGELIAETGPNGTMYYHTDALGSVTMTTDENANVLNEYRYKPYGALLSKTGTAPDPKFTWAGSQGYRSTGIAHSEFYVRMRHLGQGEARWTTIDPLTYLSWLGAGSIRPYAYVLGRAVDGTDPSGLFGNCAELDLNIAAIPGVSFTVFIELCTTCYKPPKCPLASAALQSVSTTLQDFPFRSAYLSKSSKSLQTSPRPPGPS